ncbi:MAG: FKBP-type peptidyl-prolyl cis-trans isomerase [Magnetococcales bacterium]|nr:FKBP-type peptidyl-prolyl cis-trans isomerase [Magnetococcales bacterium]
MVGILSKWSKNRDAAKTLKVGRQFLKENAKKKGVITTSSGLQYKVVKTGVGQRAKGWHKATVHYRGTFINGVEFDATDQESGPATFKVSEVIPGWSEALKLMQPGSIFELFIPSELAYGKKGAEDIIAPNETLIFTTELISLS